MSTSTKRRLKVVLDLDPDDEGAVRGAKRQRKLVVPMEKDSTVDDLRKELLKDIGHDAEDIALQIDGFELRLEDSLDVVVEDSEVIYGLVKVATCAVTQLECSPPQNSSLDFDADKCDVEMKDDFCPGHYQVHLVSAELARQHAKGNPKNTTPAMNGLPAFGGKFINSNTTLGSLRLEAARLFNWGLESTSRRCSREGCKNSPQTSCSCAIAFEIERDGLFSTLHCRFSVDGTQCPIEGCPYAHTKLHEHTHGTLPPHCDICSEALGFPCPKCIANANETGTSLNDQIFCPLVQNVACGHLHHAHCIGPRRSSVRLSCPSGCPIETAHREARLMDVEDAPHNRCLVIVWDGDKVDRIPVVTSAPTLPGEAVVLRSEEIVHQVEQFLVENNFKRPHLSVRIHSRDPSTETTRFFQSTLISVCSSISHPDHNYKRFDLFTDFEVPIITPLDHTKAHVLVDIHTSFGPILACDCTTLENLFPLASRRMTLYVVRRSLASDSSAIAQSPLSTKQGMYLADMAWQPSTHQSDRGLAAFLSSLYLVAHSASTKGKDAEHAILSMVYTVTRFPPAARALAILFMNSSPSPEAKAALAEAVYHALLDFSATGPSAIVEYRSRTFETARILFGHILSTIDGQVTPITSDTVSAVETLALACSSSRNPLLDPVVVSGMVVERSVYHLRRPGGALYRPSVNNDGSFELPPVRLLEILAQAPGIISFTSLDVDRLRLPSTNCLVSLESIARDFPAAIRHANNTTLVTRGPLELKSPIIVAPQIVLDKDGLLAVFTGRGCGSTRDVNFFRPVHGGDVEVDINDVAHALQSVVASRIAESTWEIDSYEGVSSVMHRAPDEAIVLCLDLSESMNSASGVNGSKSSEKFNFYEEAELLVTKTVSGLDGSQIWGKGKLDIQLYPHNPFLRQTIRNLAQEYLDAIEPAHLRIWSGYQDLDPNDDIDAGSFYSEEWHDSIELISQLRDIAQRQAMTIKFSANNTVALDRDELIQLSCFISAAQTRLHELAEYLEQRMASTPTLRTGLSGNAPYDVPLELLDPRTGDLLEYPIHPLNAPSDSIFVNEDTNEWLKGQPHWPISPHATRFVTVDEVRSAVADWMSGTELIPISSPSRTRKGKGRLQETVAVTIRHKLLQRSFDLPISTPIRTLFALAHRVTAAKYQHFSLRHVGSRSHLSMFSNDTIGMTALAEGGDVELSHLTPHSRWCYEVQVVDNDIGSTSTMLLLPNASILTVLSEYHARTRAPISGLRLWNDLKDSGDGVRRGKMCDYEHTLSQYTPRTGRTIVFDVESYHWSMPWARKAVESSRNLSRLELLKELFNVFLNRAAAFDTSVALVLGLVTFSDDVSVEQELTPVFENFRQALDKVSATGNTAIYDALDTARQLLIEHRPDLPNLRKRVIIVTDGQDTSSTLAAYDVCYALQRDHIVVDSVQVGGSSDSNLHGISVATGGYRLCPKTSLSDALSIFDLETMLFSGERPSKTRQPALTSAAQLRWYGNQTMYPTDVVTVDKFPKRAEHAKLQQGVQPAAAASSTRLTTGRASDDRMKRIMRELKDLVVNPHPHMDLYVNEKDISFFKIILEAPNDIEACPYKGGCFLLTCDFPVGYPRDPPEIRFVTFILHPNVSKQGKVCIAELGRLWSSDISVKDLFNLVYGLLLEPDLDNPLEIQASMKYYDDDGTYALAAANAVKTHASKTRKQWSNELGEE